MTARPSTAASFEEFVEVETPEQVVFSYTVAGVGTRAAAALIDYAIVLLPFILLAILFSRDITGLGERGAGTDAGAGRNTWVVAIIVFGQFVTMWGYHVLFEALNDGQTPGKRQLGLRVVQDGGFSVSFASSAMRNLLRIVDMQPVLIYGVGVTAVVLSRTGKRVGDILAGTIVVQERIVPVAAPAPSSQPGDPMLAASVSVLTEDEYAVLERFLSRANALNARKRAEIGTRLAARFQPHLTGDARAPQQQLIALFERERAARAHGAPSASDTGARREQHALVAIGMPRWIAFGALVRSARQRGLAAFGDDGVSRFAAAYRELTTDLARLQTAARGRDVDALYFVSRLVAAGHSLMYRRPRIAVRSVRRYLMVTVPGEVRRSIGPIALAALAMFGPAAIAYTATVRRPSVAKEFLSPGMIDRAENAAARMKDGKGYVDVPTPYQPLMASSIIANNVQVTYAAFGFGMTAGIGTLYVLIFNGIVLGGFFGLYVSVGAGSQLLAFVAPHGLLELSAIAIAGGAGLLIASALLLPGVETRRVAFARKGRRALDLIVMSTMMLIVAGTLEGFVSPRVWPLSWKLAISAATGVVLVLFVLLGRDWRRRGSEASGASGAHATAPSVNTVQIGA
jgi:uncharacterized membrane protein SpoIIM required for sporulation/uncharacterized RDD family membrane protein YckC